MLKVTALQVKGENNLSFKGVKQTCKVEPIIYDHRLRITFLILT